MVKTVIGSYWDIHNNIHFLDNNSELTIDKEMYSCTSKYGAIVRQLPTATHYYIDGHKVSSGTFEGAVNLLLTTKDNGCARGKRANTIYCDEIVLPWGTDECLEKLLGKSNKKENKDMVDYKKIQDDIFKEYSMAIDKHFMVRPQIVNYKYNESTGETVIFWDDKTQTTVKADPDTEQSQYTGFVSACAKKLFGNKSTYLNQFDKWTVKIPERERLAAEKKAAEDKEREEAKARKVAKKAKRREEREIERLAKSFANDYYNHSAMIKAEKIAMEKYGVPKSYFEGDDCSCCCKEYDTVEENNIDESDISD